MHHTELKPVLPVMRSRQHLLSQGVRFLAEDAVNPSPLPITPDGVTYTMAQEVAWIDTEHFAVGRWDGSLSIFAFNNSPTAGPVIDKVVNTPAFEGVQMIAWVAPGLFASSNDDTSFVLWSSLSGDWSDLRQIAVLKFDRSMGAANSGTAVALGSERVLTIGHSNGFVSIWTNALKSDNWKMRAAVNVQNRQPTNPWGLHNIRGIALLSAGAEVAYLIAGSEDGYITVLRVPDGIVLSQSVYNPAAQRGINDISAWGQHVLVANCAVGSSDKNLWYYTIDEKDWSLTLRDCTNLRVNPSAPQVFNFCSIWAQINKQACFFASTEEGALWMGTINRNRRLEVWGYQAVYGSLGSALAFNANGNLAVVNYNLYEFKVSSEQSPLSHDHPERMRRNLLP